MWYLKAFSVLSKYIIKRSNKSYGAIMIHSQEPSPLENMLTGEYWRQITNTLKYWVSSI